MNTTKKMLVGLTGKKEFAIPFQLRSTGNCFCGIKTGEEYKQAVVTFIGRSIEPKDVVEKCKISKALVSDKVEALSFINSYFEQLANYKIGNLLEIIYAENGSYRLIKVSERPPTENKRRLP